MDNNHHLILAGLAGVLIGTRLAKVLDLSQNRALRKENATLRYAMQLVREGDTEEAQRIWLEHVKFNSIIEKI